jgi:hypothetical protein
MLPTGSFRHGGMYTSKTMWEGVQCRSLNKRYFGGQKSCFGANLTLTVIDTTEALDVGIAIAGLSTKRGCVSVATTVHIWSASVVPSGVNSIGISP